MTAKVETSATDPFACLGVERTFDLDPKQLQEIWQEKQHTCHPDRFVGESESERLAAMQISQEINRAYQILREPVSRAIELLKREGVDDISLYRHQLDEDFLEALIETREAISEAGALSDPLALLNTLVGHAKTQKQELMRELSTGFSQTGEKDKERLAGLTLQLQFIEKTLREIREAESRLLDDE
jgi:molecular chaperone HscB